MQRLRFAAIAGILVVSACAGPRLSVAPKGSSDGRSVIERALPPSVPDRGGWVQDLYMGFTQLAIDPNLRNVCAVVAEIDQESGFQVDPIIPGLPQIAWREIDDRAAHAGVPAVVVRGVLQLKSADGRSFAARIDQARTEKQLSDVYEDFIDSVPMGRNLFEDRNPIRTRGPMQVQVSFAERFSESHPYPYPVTRSIGDEVFTRRGGVYFGIAHLLGYTAPYDRYLYRFADFNAGQYASRNAAFQRAVALASATPLVADGALLPHDPKTLGTTELAVRGLAARLGMDQDDLHTALAQGRTPQFEQSELYQRVFALADRSTRHPLPRAQVPRIELHGPKLTRKLTTAWYAARVNERFERCLAR